MGIPKHKKARVFTLNPQKRKQISIETLTPGIRRVKIARSGGLPYPLYIQAIGAFLVLAAPFIAAYYTPEVWPW